MLEQHGFALDANYILDTETTSSLSLPILSPVADETFFSVFRSEKLFWIMKFEHLERIPKRLVLAGSH